MVALILVAILVIVLAQVLAKGTWRQTAKIYFVGPHGTGKTVSILSLLGLSSETVTTLSDHKVLYNNREIVELIPDDTTQDFIRRFHLNSDDRFVFFVKNEEEMDAFSDCSPFNVTFVMWKKTESKSRSDLVYLEESQERLRDLVLRL